MLYPFTASYTITHKPGTTLAGISQPQRLGFPTRETAEDWAIIVNANAKCGYTISDFQVAAS